MRILIGLLTLTLAFGQEIRFDQYFTGQTLRFDYDHSGNATEEHFSRDGIRLEGPWPGSRTQLIDPLGYGKYRAEVVDPATGKVIYSRGFSSIYGEYETTGPAIKGEWGSYHESVRFPEPKAPVQLRLSKRNDMGILDLIVQFDIDPQGRGIDRSPITPRGKVWEVFTSGAPERKVDILVLGDGYRKRDRARFRKDVKLLIGALFETEPFKSRKSDFNVRAIAPPAQQSGIRIPRYGLWRDSPLGLTYDFFGSERYILTANNRELREIAAQAPYDALILLANEEKYGGGGILNLYAASSTHSGRSRYVVIHEFGHSFAGLGDEYYTSSVAYEQFNAEGVEPEAPNITALLDPANLKWGHLVDGNTPLPTLWDQSNFDKIADSIKVRRDTHRSKRAPEEFFNQLFSEEQALKNSLLEAEAYYGKVGAFEGAQYQGKGLYRPELNCIMFTRHTEFCRVCSAAIERTIDLYVR